MTVTKYEYTRTIRQKLIEGDVQKLKESVTIGDELSDDTLYDFLKTYKALIDSFDKTFLYTDTKGYKAISKKVEIKKEWARSFAKDTYYKKGSDGKTLGERVRGKKYSADNFEKELGVWFSKNNELYSKLETLIHSPDHEQTALSDIAYYVNQFHNKDNYSLVEKLAEEGILNNKRDDTNIQNFKDSFVELQKALQSVLLHLAPNLKNGVEIVRGSFNYYTVNKFTDFNYEERLQKITDKFLEPYICLENEKKLLKTVGFPHDESQLSIQGFYEELKSWKADQKLRFNESITKNGSLTSLKQMFPIFSNDRALQSYIEKTKEIEILSSKFNQNKDNNLKIEIQNIKKKRGELFMYNWGFNEWFFYCEIFKKVAVKYGQLKAKKRSLEQDQIESRLLQYWSLIIRSGDEYQLFLVPRNKMSDFNNQLRRIEPKKDSTKHIIKQSSITLRALEKLIRKNLSKEIPDLADEQEAISLYKKVLKGDFQDIKLDSQKDLIRNIKNSGLFEKCFSSLEEFRIALEQHSYLQEVYPITDEILSSWRNEYGAILLKISAYDYERNITGGKKDHSKLWDKYWHAYNKENNFPIRLNPEVRIFYRPIKEQKETVKQNNRFSREQFVANFTFTENASQKKVHNSYQNEKEQKVLIDKFNTEVFGSFVKEQGENLWYYGIDRGSQELATLCVVKFSKDEYSATAKNGDVKKLPKPVPAQLQLYKIKDHLLTTSKKIKVDTHGKVTDFTCWKNPSYFLEDEFLEKTECACIDLTTAKLIKGKIILNGDIATFLALKRASSKRQLFDKFADIDAHAKIEYDKKKTQFKVKSNNDRNPYVLLSFWHDSLLKIVSRDEFMNELQEYLDVLRDNKTGIDCFSIDQINNLRDAITANMVGVIAHLFKSFPGAIGLENLSRGHTEGHFKKSNENISRRLEWSLYKKFQKIGLVPPKLKDTIFQREENKISNFGVIHFVETENTSANCPFCEEKTVQDKQNVKFKKHHYECNNQNCKFTTENPMSPMEFIDNSDSVASYNIAKLCCKRIHEK